MIELLNYIKEYLWDRSAYEAWCVGIRCIEKAEDDLLNNNRGAFALLKPNLVYWYADPIIREIYGKTYVFMEAFNKWDGLGCIAVSEVNFGRMKRPKIALTEPFHLSFPEIFAYKGSYYMIPETGSTSEFRFYKMGRSATEWKLYRAIKTEMRFADTAVYVKEDNIYLITTESKRENPFVNRLFVFRVKNFGADKNIDIEEIYGETVNDYGHNKRNGGSLLSACDGKLIRVIQNSEDGFYGKYLSFKKIEKIDHDSYREIIYGETIQLNSIDYHLSLLHKTKGIHTYGRSGNYEVIDIKTESVSLAVIISNCKKRFLSRHGKSYSNV